MKKLLLLGCALLLPACATVIRGAKETAKFESVPAGATVTAESKSDDKIGPFSCVTPCELQLKRKRDWNVEFELAGYKPATGVLKSVVTGGGVASGAGNAIAGVSGLIGIGVDAGTGANKDLRPNPIIAQLETLESGKPSIVLDNKTEKVASVE